MSWYQRAFGGIPPAPFSAVFPDFFARVSATSIASRSLEATFSRSSSLLLGSGNGGPGAGRRVLNDHSRILNRGQELLYELLIG